MEVYEMITIKDLTVSYQDTLALEPLSLTIKEPTITGIIGPNGAGKSTLLKGMLGIIDHQGQTLLDQKPLQNSLQRVAYVEQKIKYWLSFSYQSQRVCLFGTLPSAQAFSGAKEFPLEQGGWGIENCRFRRLGRAPD